MGITNPSPSPSPKSNEPHCPDAPANPPRGRERFPHRPINLLMAAEHPVREKWEAERVHPSRLHSFPIRNHKKFIWNAGGTVPSASHYSPYDMGKTKVFPWKLCCSGPAHSSFPTILAVKTLRQNPTNLTVQTPRPTQSGRDGFHTVPIYFLVAPERLFAKNGKPSASGLPGFAAFSSVTTRIDFGRGGTHPYRACGFSTLLACENASPKSNEPHCPNAPTNPTRGRERFPHRPINLLMAAERLFTKRGRSEKGSPNASRWESRICPICSIGTSARKALWPYRNTIIPLTCPFTLEFVHPFRPRPG